MKKRFFFDRSNTFCINLDKRKDRWEVMSLKLEQLGLEVTRWRATEPDEVIDLFEAPTSTPTQRACAQSHIRVWRHIVGDPAIPYALILEDDVSFLKEWRTLLEEAPLDFDLLLLNSSKFFFPLDRWTRATRCYLAGGYLLPRGTAVFLLQSFQDRFTLSDWMLRELQLQKKCFTYFPYLIIQSSVDSDIEGSFPNSSHTKVVEQLAAYQKCAVEDYV